MNTSKRDSSLSVQLIAITLARLMINVSLRMVYPFLPAFSRVMGVPIEKYIQLISLRSALGISAPIFGLLPDRFGRRNIMLAATIVLAAAAAAMALWPGNRIFVAFLLVSIGAYFLFYPSQQAYLSEQVPYRKRGRIIAIAEISWSASVVLVMMVGWVMTRAASPEIGLSRVFSALALMCVVACVLLWRVLIRQPESRVSTSNLYLHWKTILNNRRVMVGVLPGILISGASESLSVVFAVWLEGSFALALTGLGVAMGIIGAAELVGEGGVVLLSDRLGKRRTIALGIGLSTLAYLVLPAVGTSLAGSLIALFLVYFAFEFAIVANLPMITELMPDARPSVMSANIAGQSLGRMLGALLGGVLLPLGIGVSGIAAAGINLVALVVLLWWVRENESG